jgi:hypothetical protein
MLQLLLRGANLGWKTEDEVEAAKAALYALLSTQMAFEVDWSKKMYFSCQGVLDNGSATKVSQARKITQRSASDTCFGPWSKLVPVTVQGHEQGQMQLG